MTRAEAEVLAKLLNKMHAGSYDTFRAYEHSHLPGWAITADNGDSTDELTSLADVEARITLYFDYCHMGRVS